MPCGGISWMVEAASSLTLEPAGRVREADQPSSPVVRFGLDRPLRLDAGIDLAAFQIASPTYGSLNVDRRNAVLIRDALAGDQRVANIHPVRQKPGSWETMFFSSDPVATE